jgi:hypothetical protein
MPVASALGLTYDLGAATRAGDRTLAGLHVDAVVLSGRYVVVSTAAMMGVSEPGLRGFLDAAGGAVATA